MQATDKLRMKDPMHKRRRKSSQTLEEGVSTNTSRPALKKAKTTTADVAISAESRESKETNTIQPSAISDNSPRPAQTGDVYYYKPHELPQDMFEPPAAFDERFGSEHESVSRRGAESLCAELVLERDKQAVLKHMIEILEEENGILVAERERGERKARLAALRDKAAI